MRSAILAAVLVLLASSVGSAAPTDCTPCWAVKQYPLTVSALRTAQEKGAVANADDCEERARDAEKLAALLIWGGVATEADAIARAVVGHCATCACLEAIH